MKWILLASVILTIVLIACQSKEDKSPGSQKKQAEPTQVVPTANFSDGTPLLIGTYTQDMGWVNGKAAGMHVAVLRDGKVELVESVEVGPNPSFVAVHPNGKYAYAVNEVGGSADQPEGMVTAMSIDSSGGIEIINSRSSLGTFPCHVSVNQYGTQLLVANYGNGTIASFPIAMNGRTGRDNDLVQFHGKKIHDRQDGPHAHFIKEGPDKKIYTADLGTDTIRIFNLNGGALERAGFIETEDHAGPRHLAFHGALPLTYILNELNGTVEIWERNGSGHRRIQTVSTIANDGNGENAHCGAIKITSNSKFLFTSNRGEINAISRFSVAADGKLTLLSTTSTQGRTPRDMEIDPSGRYLLVANQDSDNIVTFEIDGSSGALTNPKITQGIMTPSCITFL